MKIILFGSTDCIMCKLAEMQLTKSNLRFDFVNALDDATQSICDEYNVDELPKVCVIDEKNNIVVLEQEIVISVEEIVKFMKDNEVKNVQ